MGPYSEMVYDGYIWIPDKGSILRAHGMYCRAGSLTLGAPLIKNLLCYRGTEN